MYFNLGVYNQCLLFCRRITYQETSQTFGVISTRLDIQGSNGTSPARPSASTQAQNSSSSSSAKLMTASSSSLLEHVYGDEIEVHSLLILDQHTFEGKIVNIYRIIIAFVKAHLS